MQLRFVASVLAACATYAHADASLPHERAGRKLDDVIVTATRFEEASPRTAGNIFVLTREEIDRIPAASVPDLLAGMPGTHVLPLYGALGIDSVINLRGAGNVGTATSNTLVLLNGQRLNPIDSGSIDWSLVPLSSIERIEIMPGSGTVMYGDRATGGVINIITRKGVTGSHAQAGLGSYGLREMSAQTGWEIGGADANVHFQYGSSDGWRRNADQERYSAGGRLGFGQSDALRGFVDVSAFNERIGTPGGLWRADYVANPTASLHPGDRSNREGFRIRPGLQMALTSAIDFDADLTLSKDERSGYSDATNPKEQVRNLSRDFIAFSPKFKGSYLLGGINSKATAGYDFYRGSADNATTPADVAFDPYKQNATQHSHAIYLQNLFELDRHWSLSLGWRGQRLHQQASQSAYDGNPAMSGNSRSTRSAWETGLSYQADAWRVYARTGLMYRFPNTDELYGLDPVSFEPAFVASLKPQHGQIREVGASVKTTQGVYAISLYQQDLKDEITSDPIWGGNMNLAGTRRRGVDMNAKLRFTDELRGSVSLTRQQAIVDAGTYAGYELPMIPKVLASAMLSWGKINGYSLSARVNYVSKRRYGDDYASEAGYLDGYTTLDVSAAWQVHRWKIEARLMNLTDVKYAAYGGYGFNMSLPTPANDTFYYPADPRSFRILARYDF